MNLLNYLSAKELHRVNSFKQNYVCIRMLVLVLLIDYHYKVLP